MFKSSALQRTGITLLFFFVVYLATGGSFVLAFYEDGQAIYEANHLETNFEATTHPSTMNMVFLLGHDNQKHHYQIILSQLNVAQIDNDGNSIDFSESAQFITFSVFLPTWQENFIYGQTQQRSETFSKRQILGSIHTTVLLI